MYAHADELGGYRAPQKKWGAKNPSENKDRRSANETRAISARTRRQACRRVRASLALPTGRNPFLSPSPILPYPFPVSHLPFWAFLSIFKLHGETRYREQRRSTDSRRCR